MYRLGNARFTSTSSRRTPVPPVTLMPAPLRLAPDRPRTIDLRSVTLLALIVTQPRMSSPSRTVPGVVTTRSPSRTVRAVPAGTPVLVGPGRAPDGASLATVTMTDVVLTFPAASVAR